MKCRHRHKKTNEKSIVVRNVRNGARKASLREEENSIVGEANVFKNKVRDVYVRIERVWKYVLDPSCIQRRDDLRKTKTFSVLLWALLHAHCHCLVQNYDILSTQTKAHLDHRTLDTTVGTIIIEIFQKKCFKNSRALSTVLLALCLLKNCKLLIRTNWGFCLPMFHQDFHIE